MNKLILPLIASFLVLVLGAGGCAAKAKTSTEENIGQINNQSCGKEINYPTGKKGHGCIGRPYGVGS